MAVVPTTSATADAYPSHPDLKRWLRGGALAVEPITSASDRARCARQGERTGEARAGQPGRGRGPSGPLLLLRFLRGAHGGAPIRLTPVETASLSYSATAPLSRPPRL